MSFQVQFIKRSYVPDDTDDTNDANDTNNDTNRALEVDERHQEILKLIVDDGTISAQQLSEILNVSVITIKRDLQALKGVGRVERIGNNKTGRWIVK